MKKRTAAILSLLIAISPMIKQNENKNKSNFYLPCVVSMSMNCSVATMRLEVVFSLFPSTSKGNELAADLLVELCTIDRNGMWNATTIIFSLKMRFTFFKIVCGVTKWFKSIKPLVLRNLRNF